MLKYKAPATRAFPSLSNVGAEDLAPKYLSSKESNEAKAADAAELAVDAEDAALVSEVAALLADVDAADALEAALVADVAASPAFVVAIPA